MNRPVVILLMAACCSTAFTYNSYGQSKNGPYLLIGGYTKAGEAEGIAVYNFDTTAGNLSFHSVTGGIENPSYFTVSKDGDYVYAVSESGADHGAVVSYRFDPIAGKLTMINQAPSGGRGPCYIAVDDDRKHLFVANYSSGSVGVIQLNKDGSMDTAGVQSIQHVGSSINKESQQGPHAHSVLPCPDNRYVLSADLGTDKLYCYQMNDSAATTLTPAATPFVRIPPGSGPRHICFHPNGRWVYVVNEMAGSVSTFDYADGALSFKQTISMLPEGFSGTVEAADIHISPDGSFLYASNREERNEIVIYRIDAKGVLTLVGRQPVMGHAPRNFVIDPSGKFVLVGNMNSNRVVVFRRDAATGMLQFTGNTMKVSAPACLKFVEGKR